MSIGIYLGDDYAIKREDGYDAALRYLNKKIEARRERRSLALVPWVAATLAVWAIVFGLFYAF